MMTAERARELLHAYGSNASKWPQEYRAELRTFMVQNADAGVQGLASVVQQELERNLRAAEQLDSLLDSYQPSVPDLSQQIMEALPISLSERLLAWVLPQRMSECWRPAMAAAFPLLLGLAIGLQDLPIPGVPDLAATDWEATEAALLTSSLAEVWYD